MIICIRGNVLYVLLLSIIACRFIGYMQFFQNSTTSFAKYGYSPSDNGSLKKKAVLPQGNRTIAQLFLSV